MRRNACRIQRAFTADSLPFQRQEPAESRSHGCTRKNAWVARWLGRHRVAAQQGKVARVRHVELQERQLWCPPLPDAFPRHYALAGYKLSQIRRIAHKYLHRTENLKRAWARIHHHLPETTALGPPLDILEFSTAHGAMLEVWRHMGHQVRGTDFAGWPEDYGRKNRITRVFSDLLAADHDLPRAGSNFGWLYQPLIESLGLTVDLFDGGLVPYRYDSKSFDVVCCYQAIEAYGPPETWDAIAAEFCRIARKVIVIGFNPPPVSLRNNDDHAAQVRAATERLRRWNTGGFRTGFLEFGQTRAGLHPKAVKLVAGG
jgi:hypothetical protein